MRSANNGHTCAAGKPGIVCSPVYTISAGIGHVYTVNNQHCGILITEQTRQGGQEGQGCLTDVGVNGCRKVQKYRESYVRRCPVPANIDHIFSWDIQWQSSYRRNSVTIYRFTSVPCAQGIAKANVGTWPWHFLGQVTLAIWSHVRSWGGRTANVQCRR